MSTKYAGTLGGTDVREGRFEAVFANGRDAKAFYDRLAGDPAAWYAADVKINRKGGRIVTWTATEGAWKAGGRDAFPTKDAALFSYWVSMAETVGYYGSTFGEPPYGAGRRTAYLNGRPGTASAPTVRGARS